MQTSANITHCEGFRASSITSAIASIQIFAAARVSDGRAFGLLAFGRVEGDFGLLVGIESFLFPIRIQCCQL